MGYREKKLSHKGQLEINLYSKYKNFLFVLNCEISLPATDFMLKPFPGPHVLATSSK